MGNIVSLGKVRKARERAVKASAPPLADALSFVTRRKPRGGGSNYWDVKPTGNYCDDYAAGKAFAEEYIAFLGLYPTYGNTTLLGGIVVDMLPGGRNGMVIGFMNTVGVYATGMAANLKQREGQW
ncbi:hypothetical protein ACMDCR_25760 [Labrys okinawensis]|uniref:hypothetical protein n=1 Tax=Labrys okinawensis TaxID=346911 RepID=UPI0039BC6411